MTITQRGPGWYIQHNGLQVQCTGDRALVELMAAAPELLAACQMAGRSMTGTDGQFDIIADAVRKALGRHICYDLTQDIAYDLADDEDNG